MRSLKFVVLALSAVMLAGPALAQTTNYSTKIVYYSDATKTVVVGRELDLCDGGTVVTGTQTPFYNVFSGSCP